MLLVASAVFIYYTIWAILLVSLNLQLTSFLYVNDGIQPFFDDANPIHSWFLPREWAVRLPAFILVVGLSAIGLFLGSTIMKENRRKAQQARLRTA